MEIISNKYKKEDINSSFCKCAYLSAGNAYFSYTAKKPYFPNTQVCLRIDIDT